MSQGTYGYGIYGENAYGGIAYQVGLDGEVIGDQLVFTPPAVDERLLTYHPLFRRVRYAQPVSILRFGASYKQFRDPDPGDIEAADAAYLGGRSYIVDGFEASRLSEAGYGEFLSFYEPGVVTDDSPDLSEVW